MSSLRLTATVSTSKQILANIRGSKTSKREAIKLTLEGLLDKQLLSIKWSFSTDEKWIFIGFLRRHILLGYKRTFPIKSLLTNVACSQNWVTSVFRHMRINFEAPEALEPTFARVHISDRASLLWERRCTNAIGFSRIIYERERRLHFVCLRGSYSPTSKPVHSVRRRTINRQECQPSSSSIIMLCCPIAYITVIKILGSYANLQNMTISVCHSWIISNYRRFGWKFKSSQLKRWYVLGQHNVSPFPSPRVFRIFEFTLGSVVVDLTWILTKYACRHVCLLFSSISRSWVTSGSHLHGGLLQGIRMRRITPPLKAFKLNNKYTQKV